MFETVQIARRHLMRYQYPELDSAMEASTSWSAALAGTLSSWFSPPPQDDESEPDTPEDNGPDDVVLLYCWPTYPY